MFQLRILGGADLRNPAGWTVQSALVQPKRLALLSYLTLAHPHGFHRRETLLNLFWPEVDSARARNTLNQAVHFLRKSLEEGIVISRGEELGVNLDRLSCDALELETALEGGKLEEAVDLYAGDLLPGLHVTDAPGFERWLTDRRERLRSCTANAAWMLAEQAERNGDPHRALVCARRAADLEPESESALRRLMLLQARSGDRAGALLRFDTFTRHLEEELALTPSPETVELAKRIRSSPTVASPDEPGPAEHPIEVRAPLAAAPAAPAAPAGTGAAGKPVEAPAPPTLRPIVDGRMRIPSLRTGLLLIALAAGVAVLWLGAAQVRFLGGGGRAEGREVLVADFASPTGDSILARVVTEALKIDLARSRVVQTMDPRSIRLALGRMERANSPLSSGIARELALREGIGAVAVGEIASVGRGFLLSARVVSPDSERTVAAFRETAKDSTDLIPAIDRLSEQLRRSLGESARAMRQVSPLESVTTHSLDALRSYSLAVEAIDVQGDYARGIALLREAVAADPGFAMAHRKLGVALLNQGGPTSQVLDAYEKAYQNRDRLPDRERYMVIAAYHGTSLQEAIGVYSELLERYPNDVYALNNLGFLHAEIGDYDRAAEFYQRAVQADSSFALAPANLVLAHFNRGDTVAARNALATFARRFPGNPWALNHAGDLAAATGRYRDAEEFTRRLLAQQEAHVSWRIDAYQNLARLAAVQGKLDEAEAHLTSAMRDAQQSAAADEYVLSGLTLAMLDLHARDSAERALERIRRVLAAQPLETLPPGDRPFVELAWLYALAGDSERTRAMLQSLRRSLDPRLRREIEQKSQAIRAAVLFSEKKYDEAVPLLRTLDRRGCPICPLPLLARASEGAGSVDSAIVAYESYLDTPFMERLEQDAVWLPVVYRRLAELHARAGRAQRSEFYTLQLRRLRSDADAAPVR